MRDGRGGVVYRAMCLGIPGRVIEIVSDDPPMRTAKVSFGGIVKDVNLSFVPEAALGDYVVVHVGFAISRLDEDAAVKVFETLDQMDALNDLAEGPA